MTRETVGLKATFIEVEEVKVVGKGGGDPVKTTFTYTDRLDVTALRSALGLDGGTRTGDPVTLGRIATRLLRRGFLSSDEVESIGGKIIDTSKDE